MCVCVPARSWESDKLAWGEEKPAMRQPGVMHSQNWACPCSIENARGSSGEEREGVLKRPILVG